MKITLMASLLSSALTVGAMQAKAGPELTLDMNGDATSGISLSLVLELPPAAEDLMPPLPAGQELRPRNTQDGAAPTRPQGTPPPGFGRTRDSGCSHFGVVNSVDGYATWTGGCDAEGFTTGAGILRYHYSTPPDGGRPAFFEGRVVRGMADGPGVSVLTNGNRLEASFRYGLAEGQGRWLFSNGGRYEGEFRSGRRTGQARIIYSDGGLYEGAVVEGSPHGLGKLIKPDGSSYTGHFREGRRHGQGTFVRPGRYMVEGLYQDGKAEGRARVSLADGRCFIGVMRNNRFDTSDPINRPCE